MASEAQKDRFDKFTEPARKVFQLGFEEAQNLSHPEIGTEHLLLGVVRHTSLAFRMSLNVELASLRAEVRTRFISHNPIEVPKNSLTKGGNNVICLAIFSAVDRGEQYIGISHLVRGLVRVGYLEGFKQELGSDLLNKLCQEGNITPREFVDKIRLLETQTP